MNGTSSSRNIMHRPITKRERTVEFIQVVSNFRSKIGVSESYNSLNQNPQFAKLGKKEL